MSASLLSQQVELALQRSLADAVTEVNGLIELSD